MGAATKKLIVLTLVAAITLAAGAQFSAAKLRHRARGTSPALFNREQYDATTGFTPLEAARHRVIVLQSPDARWVPYLHRWNPRLKVLVYQHVSFARADDPQASTVCTSLPADSATHRDWFLSGANGAPISTGVKYLMDIGNPAYQQACFANAIALAKGAGFDGVFLDGVDSSISYQFPAGANPAAAKYPSARAWQAAMYSLLRYGGQAVHAQGLLLFSNLGGVLAPGMWQQWNSPLDGAEEESWTDGGLGLAQQLPYWSRKLANVAWSEAHGKGVLLPAGRASYSTSATYASQETWYPEYGTAQRLGAPVGAYKRRGNGVFERAFTNGLVLVNPTTLAIRRFSLHRRYSGSGLTRVRALAMGPTSGLILLKSR